MHLVVAANWQCHAISSSHPKPPSSASQRLTSTNGPPSSKDDNGNKENDPPRNNNCREDPLPRQDNSQPSRPIKRNKRQDGRRIPHGSKRYRKGRSDTMSSHHWRGTRILSRRRHIGSQGKVRRRRRRWKAPIPGRPFAKKGSSNNPSNARHGETNNRSTERHSRWKRSQHRPSMRHANSLRGRRVKASIRRSRIRTRLR